LGPVEGQGMSQACFDKKSKKKKNCLKNCVQIRKSLFCETMHVVSSLLVLNTLSNGQPVSIRIIGHYVNGIIVFSSLYAINEFIRCFQKFVSRIFSTNFS
jgi:hypothetical protein